MLGEREETKNCFSTKATYVMVLVYRQIRATFVSHKANKWSRYCRAFFFFFFVTSFLFAISLVSEWKAFDSLVSPIGDRRVLDSSTIWNFDKFADKVLRM